jgi:hypothetical protein
MPVELALCTVLLVRVAVEPSATSIPTSAAFSIELPVMTPFVSSPVTVMPSV